MRIPITLAMAAALALEFPQPVAAQEKANGAKGINAQLEANFDQQLSSTHIGENIKTFSSKPHNVGAAEGKTVAEKILSQYSWDHIINQLENLLLNVKDQQRGRI